MSVKKLLRLREVLALYPVSRSTWLKGVADGIYPRAIKLGKRSVAWDEADLLQLIEERKAK